MDLDKKVNILCLSYHNYCINIWKNYILEQLKRRKQFKKRLTKRLQVAAKIFCTATLTNQSIFITNRLQKRSPPKIWMKQRSKEWWNQIVNSSNFDEFVENFRIDKNTFQWLCEKLRPALEPGQFCVRQPLTVEIKVAIALYKLASCSEYRVVGNQFGVHKTSVYRSLKQFCKAMIDILLHEEIKMPNIEETETISAKFEEKSGVPLVIGAIDGTHIPVTPPLDGYRDFINRKNWPSLVLQGLVDADYK